MNPADDILEANFELVQNNPIDATFTINAVGQDLNYVHYQDVASTEWTINHSLGKFPSVTIVDSSGNMVIGDVHFTDTNHLEIYFNAAFAGRAYLN